MNIQCDIRLVFAIFVTKKSMYFVLMTWYTHPGMRIDRNVECPHATDNKHLYFAWNMYIKYTKLNYYW